MARYHINGKGEPGVCRATQKCPFGDLQEDHYSSPEEARKGYEKNFKNYMDGQKLEKASKASPSKEAVLSYEGPLHKSVHTPGSKEYFDYLRKSPEVRAKVEERVREINEEARARYEELNKTEEGRATLAAEAQKARQALNRAHEKAYLQGGSSSYYIGARGRVVKSLNPPAPRERTFATEQHAKAHRDVWRQELMHHGMSRSDATSALHNWTTNGGV